MAKYYFLGMFSLQRSALLLRSVWIWIWAAHLTLLQGGCVPSLYLPRAKLCGVNGNLAVLGS